MCMCLALSSILQLWPELQPLPFAMLRMHSMLSWELALSLMQQAWAWECVQAAGRDLQR